MKIETEDYTITYEPKTETVIMRGYLRLEGLQSYQPIQSLLLEAAKDSDICILDLQDLEFLNSSGISMLAIFVMAMRNKDSTQLVFRGSKNILWQTRSLKNLKRLMPKLELDLVE